VKRSGKWASIKVSRFVCQQLTGPLLSGEVVRHSCDNPGCLNPDHLMRGSQKQNIADMVSRNRQASGERHGGSKITWDIVVQIRECASRGNKQRDIANIFNINQATVSRIIKNQIWKNSDESPTL
jgi:predicted XRE-type DNA-binding protein